jgi:phenolic acid decarboxylase
MTEASAQGIPNVIGQYLKDKKWIEEPEVLPWYVKDLVDLEPMTKELFETYSKVPSEEVVAHITQIRNKAFKIVSQGAQYSSHQS